MDVNDVEHKLNEQQSTIDHLKQELEDMGDANATLETEILKLRQQLQDWDDMVELATKTSLRNVELDEQIGQLRKELNDCEKFRYTVFKRMGELNDE